MKERLKPRVGLLPFYLKLYDDLMPDRQRAFEPFLAQVAEGLRSRGLTVDRAPVCRVAPEFASAIESFERNQADAIVTLHLAYSPSLESVDVIRRSTLPLVILDTTMDAAFGRNVNPDRIMLNHGVHGVMDFASMLRRYGHPYEIVAGSFEQAGTLDRAADRVRAAVAARAFGCSRALRVGQAFAGMGDFSVDERVLSESLGICVDEVDLDVLDKAVAAVSETSVEQEVADDTARFACVLDPAVHRRSVRVGLGLRHLLACGGYHALSVNFQAFDRNDRPADTMPFLEISKAMARGIGYGGEGDVLTAALVGALARGFGDTTFTEIFCADWSGNSLFLSHMGEISPVVARGRPRVFEKPFPFGGARNPAVLTCDVQPGPAVYVNLAPGPDQTFGLIVAPVDVLPEDDTLDPAMQDVVRAWIRPKLDVARFLERNSLAGGTHHSALVLGDRAEALAAFGRLLGMDVTFIG